MADTKQRIIIDGVDFGAILRFPRVLRSVFSSLQPSRVFLGALAIAITLIAGSAWDRCTPATVNPSGLLAEVTPDEAAARDEALRLIWTTWDQEGARPEAIDASATLAMMDDAWTDRGGRLDEGRFALDRITVQGLMPRDTFESTVAAMATTVQSCIVGILTLDAGRVGAGAADLFVVLPRTLGRDHPFFLIVIGSIFLATCSIAGASIARTAACDYAQRERPPVRAVIAFSLRRWTSVVSAPVLPLLMAAGLALVSAVLGLAFAVPGLDIAAAVLWPIQLFIGLAVAFLIVGAIIGGPMLLPAVACESCDAIDAQQRAFAFALNRPFHLAGYLLSALVALAVGWLLVGGLATITLAASAGAAGAFVSSDALAASGAAHIFDLGAGIDALPTTASATQRIAFGILAFWEMVVLVIVAGWLVSFVFSSSTAVYLNQREVSDGQSVDDIWHEGLAPGSMVPLSRSARSQGDKHSPDAPAAEPGASGQTESAQDVDAGKPAMAAR